MLNIRSQGRERSLILNLFISLFLLLIFSSSAFAQSSADLAATRDWLKSKAQDRNVRAALRSSPNDPCVLQKETGPHYDPLPCIDKQKKEWAAMLQLARGDAKASPTVINTIQKIVKELSAQADRWNALSPAEKDRQIAIGREIAEQVKKSDNNIQRGLQTIINDPSRSQDTRATAGTMLAASRGRGSWCVPDCICVGPYACPCCSGFPPPSWIISRR